MNTLDSLRAAKSLPFRILVQIPKAEYSYVIAVGSSEEEIERDWVWLEENLLGVLGEEGRGKEERGEREGEGGEREGNREREGEGGELRNECCVYFV